MKDLHDSYVLWCDSSGLEPLSGTLFGKELSRLGFETVKSKKGNGRLGIGLKQPLASTSTFANKRSMSPPVHPGAPSDEKQWLN
jgi:hypothetical protein